MNRSFYLYVLAIALLLATGKLIDIYWQTQKTTGRYAIAKTTTAAELQKAESELRYFKEHIAASKTDSTTGITHSQSNLNHLKKVSLAPYPIDSAQIKSSLDPHTDWYTWQMKCYNIKLLALPVACIADSLQTKMP